MVEGEGGRGERSEREKRGGERMVERERGREGEGQGREGLAGGAVHERRIQLCSVAI